jgi:glutaredoxin
MFCVRRPFVPQWRVRCKTHDLACGSDGLCVLCRRQPPGSQPSTRAMLVLGFAAALFMGAAVVYRVQSVQAPTQPTAARVETATTGPPMLTPTAATIPTGTETHRWLHAVDAPLNSTPVASGHAAAFGAMPSAVSETAPQSAPESAATTVNVHVVVYTTSWCPHCREAKAWMATQGIDYEERDIEASSENKRMMNRINSRGSIPTFDVDGQVMVGFSATALTSLLQQARARLASRPL